MTTLITSDLRAIDFDHVRMVYVSICHADSNRWLHAVFDDAHHEKLFNVEGCTHDEIAMLISHVSASCMTSDHIVALEDVILCQWRYQMAKAKKDKEKEENDQTSL